MNCLQGRLDEIKPEDLNQDDWLTIRLRGDLILYLGKYVENDGNVLSVSGFVMEVMNQQGQRTLHPVHPNTSIRETHKLHFDNISSISKMDSRFAAQLDSQIAHISAAQSGIQTAKTMPQNSQIMAK